MFVNEFELLFDKKIACIPLDLVVMFVNIVDDALSNRTPIEFPFLSKMRTKMVLDEKSQIKFPTAEQLLRQAGFINIAVTILNDFLKGLYANGQFFRDGAHDLQGVRRQCAYT